MLTMHTVLEVYRVTDLSIVRVLPSADDEINTAAFHPFMVRLLHAWVLQRTMYWRGAGGARRLIKDLQTGVRW